MNIYVHFPFCRSKCAYCALHSRTGSTTGERDAYVRSVSKELKALLSNKPGASISTLYFGGGTPSLCDLKPLFEALRRMGATSDADRCACQTKNRLEFTVEVNPADISPDLLVDLKAGGVNRISMGVQSLDDSVLSAMGRPHSAAKAMEAWRMIREAGFVNAGIDLICGWPGERGATGISDGWRRTIDMAATLGVDHCSVYTLIIEQGTRLARDVDDGRTSIPSDDVALAELALAQETLGAAGLERYEISSFAKPGMECRHNLATWRGEDYIGIGEGAFSREGDAVSRVIFRLRLLKEGFSPVRAADDFPELKPCVHEWISTLDRFSDEGLVSLDASSQDATYRLTGRGIEVCDTILAELV